MQKDNDTSIGFSILTSVAKTSGPTFSILYTPYSLLNSQLPPSHFLLSHNARHRLPPLNPLLHRTCTKAPLQSDKSQETAQQPAASSQHSVPSAQCPDPSGVQPSATMAKRSRSLSQSHSQSPSLDPDSPSRSSSPSSSTPSTATLPPDRSKILHRDTNTVPFVEVMHCALPPHRETLAFASYEDYEVHYQQAHVNRCSLCSKNFPTAHFLNLHIEENHDSLVVAMRARGEKTVSTD